MRKIAVVAILVMALAFCGMAFAFQNEPEGFRGLKWGDPPTEEMEFILEDEWIVLYRNPGDELRLGDARFQRIIYVFYAPSDAPTRKLMDVLLYFKDKENFDILQTICKVKFGEPTIEQFNSLGWHASISSVTLTYHTTDQIGFMVLASWPIFRQYTQAKEKQQAEGAEKDW